MIQRIDVTVKVGDKFVSSVVCLLSSSLWIVVTSLWVVYMQKDNETHEAVVQTTV
jgi:hypothetical protein